MDTVFGSQHYTLTLTATIAGETQGSAEPLRIDVDILKKCKSHLNIRVKCWNTNILDLENRKILDYSFELRVLRFYVLYSQSHVLA